MPLDFELTEMLFIQSQKSFFLHTITVSVVTEIQPDFDSNKPKLQRLNDIIN